MAERAGVERDPYEWTDDEVLGYFARLDRVAHRGGCAACGAASNGLNRWHLCPSCADPDEDPEWL